jgi:hypothetical protein|nr:MAG TPA: hypothetical protein [Caudoviricetes sp.]
MTDKEHREILEKALAVQKCIDSIDMHNEWIQNIIKKWNSLNNIKSYWITISGYVGENGNTTTVDIALNPDDGEDMIKLIKEKLEKVIQGHEKSIYEEHEKLNSLLK